MITTAKYTAEQRKVIDIDEGAYLVTAPPGSGKTQLLVERTIRLLNESAGGSFRILALTFTTRAADELRERVAAGVADEWRRVTTCTFHAFALDVLRHYGERIGVGPELTVFENEDDRLESLAQALLEEGFGFEREEDDLRVLRSILAEISRLKRALVPASAAPSGEVHGIDVALAYQAYTRKLRQLGAVDFDDLLLLTSELFVGHPRVATHYRRLFRFVSVDEAQDTSRAQYELLRNLLGDDHKNILMVADADQAIFAFAGSDYRYLEAFERDFSAHRLQLKSNFRSARVIVEAASLLIAHNPEAGRPQMSSASDALGAMRFAEEPDEQAEAVAVSAEVERLLREGLDTSWLSAGETPFLKPEEICVLGRSRFSLASPLKALEDAGIPCQFGSGDAGLFDTELFRGLYYALRATSNPRDLLSRENLVALLGPADQAQRESLRERSSRDLLGDLAAAVSVAVDVDSLLDASCSGSSLDTALRPFTDYRPGDNVSTEDAERYVRDAEVLSERWKSFCRSTPADEWTLGGFLNHLGLTGRAALSDPGVRVLTVHAVKGLEFRAVFLVGMNEGTFPDFRSVKNPRALSDERRNAYVAVTRAARYLHVSRPRTRVMPWGDVRVQTPSRFLAELGLGGRD